MNQHYREQRSAFVQFLKQGIHNQIIPGEFTYDQILRKFNLTQVREPVVRGFTYAWFQDLYFWFDDNGLLASMSVRLKSTPQRGQPLPKALNLQWVDFASRLVPETFEELVIAEHIPCLKATKILDEDIYPPIYCLDHLGMMPRFEDNDQHNLYAINICLLRDFPRLSYTMVWPTYEPPYMLDWPNFSTS